MSYLIGFIGATIIAFGLGFGMAFAIDEYHRLKGTKDFMGL